MLPEGGICRTGKEWRGDCLGGDDSFGLPTKWRIVGVVLHGLIRFASVRLFVCHGGSVRGAAALYCCKRFGLGRGQMPHLGTSLGLHVP